MKTSHGSTTVLASVKKSNATRVRGYRGAAPLEIKDYDHSSCLPGDVCETQPRKVERAVNVVDVHVTHIQYLSTQKPQVQCILLRCE